MGEREDTRGFPVQDNTPVGSHGSMPSYPPAPREPPANIAYPQFLQGTPLHPNLQMSSYVLRESGFQMPQQPARDLCLQESQSHLVPPGIPVQSSLQSDHSNPMSNLRHILSQSPPVPAGTSMQSSFQWHPVPTGKPSQHMTQSSLVPTGDPVQSSLQRHQIPASHQNLKMSQSPLVVEATSTQSNLQWNLDPERDIGPQESPGPSMKTSSCMYSDSLMNLGTHPVGSHPVNPSLQLPSRSSGSSGFEDSRDSLEPSDTYSNQKVPLNSPEKQKKPRTVYSKQERELLQECFRKCMYPSREKRKELAQEIGVSKEQIQIWFKNQRAKHKRKKALEGVPETTEGCEGVSESTGSHGTLSVLVSATGESMSPGTSGVGSIPNLNPCLEAPLHGDQACKGARCSPKENLFDFESPFAAVHPGQPEANEAPTDPAVAEGIASAEAPLPMASAAQEPEDAQDSHSSSENLWQQVLKELYAFEDY